MVEQRYHPAPGCTATKQDTITLPSPFVDKYVTIAISLSFFYVSGEANLYLHSIGITIAFVIVVTLESSIMFKLHGTASELALVFLVRAVVILGRCFGVELLDGVWAALRDVRFSAATKTVFFFFFRFRSSTCFGDSGEGSGLVGVLCLWVPDGCQCVPLNCVRSFQ